MECPMNIEWIMCVLYDFQADDEIDQTLDSLLDFLDCVCYAGQFSDVDELLRDLNVEIVHRPSILLTILMFTNPLHVRDKLMCRELFFSV